MAWPEHRKKSKYVQPNNRIIKAQETVKLVSLGKGVLAYRIRRDVVNALNLQKGDFVWSTIEKPPKELCAKCQAEITI